MGGVCACKYVQYMSHPCCQDVYVEVPYYAHFPNKLIIPIPNSSDNIPTALFFRSAFLISPCNQSLLQSSTNATQARTPALRASIVPRVSAVLRSFPLNDFRAPMPIAMPTGAVILNARPITIF